MNEATARRLLEVADDADEEEIEAAFKAKSKEEHPDLSDHDNAAERFRRIKTARETLLSDSRTTGPASSPTGDSATADSSTSTATDHEGRRHSRSTRQSRTTDTQATHDRDPTGPGPENQTAGSTASTASSTESVSGETDTSSADERRQPPWEQPLWEPDGTPGYNTKPGGSGTFLKPELKLFLQGNIVLMVLNSALNFFIRPEGPIHSAPRLLLTPLLLLFLFVPSEREQAPANAKPLLTVPFVALAGVCVVGADTNFGIWLLFFGYASLISRTSGTAFMFPAPTLFQWGMIALVTLPAVATTTLLPLFDIFPSNAALAAVETVYTGFTLPVFRGSPLLLLPYIAAVAMFGFIYTETPPPTLLRTLRAD